MVGQCPLAILDTRSFIVWVWLLVSILYGVDMIISEQGTAR